MIRVMVLSKSQWGIYFVAVEIVTVSVAVKALSSCSVPNEVKNILLQNYYHTKRLPKVKKTKVFLRDRVLH